MSKYLEPQIVNGFKIIENLGKDENRQPVVLVICKACGNPFKTTFHSLHRIQGCLCNRPKKIISLPGVINGFRIIEDYGYEKVKDVRRALVECKECKRVYECDPHKLKYRKHCGCMKKGIVACKYVKSHPQLAQAFRHMKARCYNKNNQDYYNYGARGITICDEWLRDRNVFCEWSLKNGFENDKELSIDRIDGNQGYSPQNCKWSTAIEQGRNTRRNVLTMELAKQLRKDAKTMNYTELANKYNVCKATVWNVIAHKVWID